MSSHCPLLGGLQPSPAGPKPLPPLRRIRRALTAISAHQDAVDIIEAALLQIEQESWHRGHEQGLRKGLADGREAMCQRVLSLVGAQLAPADPGPPPAIPSTIYLSPAQVAAGLAEVERVQQDLDQSGRFTL